MAVVVIIAVMVGLAGPAMMNSFGDARARDLSGQMINLFNGARARANGSGRAQLVRFAQGDNNGQGGLIAYEGNNSSCVASDWDAIIAVGCDPINGFCTEQLDPRTRQMPGDTLQIGLRSTAPGWTTADADLCYEPSGTTLWRTTSAVFSSENGGGAGGTLRGALLFRVQRLDSGGTAVSVERQMIAPLGSTARAYL